MQLVGDAAAASLTGELGADGVVGLTRGRRLYACPRVHINRIVQEFGEYPIGSLRPSQVKSWITRLQSEELKTSYIYALHSRLAQIMTDAIHDGLIVKSPCSRRTALSVGEQRVYVATTDQVWQLYELFPERMRLAVVLGAFVGLRLAEACRPSRRRCRLPAGDRLSQSPVPGPAAEDQDVKDAGSGSGLARRAVLGPDHRLRPARNPADGSGRGPAVHVGDRARHAKSPQ